jgi:hypothetical protein
MHRLMNERVQQHSVTPLQELTQSDPVQSTVPWRAAAVMLLAVVLATAAALTRLRPTSAPETIDAPSSARSVAEDREGTSAPPDDQAATNFAVSQSSASAEGDAANAAPKINEGARATPFVISVEPSQVRSDDHFAEIRLHRNLLQRNSPFTWWTEPATAKPNFDYVPEAVAIQTFPAGFRATRLYIRLLAQPLRSQRSYFYIAIAQPGLHQAPATVIRRKIWLPAASSLQANR